MTEASSSPETGKPLVENRWKSGLIGGITGAVGATIVGLIFSSTTATFISNLFANKALPPGAVVFVSGAECGDGFKRFDLAAGRFVVAAGFNSDHPNSFQASMTNKGAVSVKLEERNLPEISQVVPYSTIGIGLGGLGNFATVVSVAVHSSDPAAVAKSSVLSIGKGKAEPIETLPPWIALTACQKLPS